MTIMANVKAERVDKKDISHSSELWGRVHTVTFNPVFIEQTDLWPVEFLSWKKK